VNKCNNIYTIVSSSLCPCTASLSRYPVKFGELDGPTYGDFLTHLKHADGELNI